LELFVDHNVSARVADLARLDGLDVLTAVDAGLERAGDEEILLFAAAQQRVVVTHNAEDFFLLHDAWTRWSRVWQVAEQHAGILVLEPQPYPRLVAELRSFLPATGAFPNELYWWRAWSGWLRRGD
jgi:predicted nuclease of predicted toxin-antitoxin system